MDPSTKFRNLFLVMDTKKEGVLNEAAVLQALQSVGLVVPGDVKAALKPMNCQQFVEFASALAKKLPSDGGLGDLFKSLAAGRSKSMDTTELRQVMDTLKVCNQADLDGLIGLLDPRGTGHFDCDALTNAFKA